MSSIRKYSGRLALVGKLVSVLLPISTIKIHNAHVHRLLIQAIHIDVYPAGIGAGDIIRLDTADLAEVVPGDTGVEAVSPQLGLSREETEVGGGHDQVQIA
jgi:hypothetical protein